MGLYLSSPFLSVLGSMAAVTGRLVKPAEALAARYTMGFWIQLLSPALLFASFKCGGWIAYRRFEQPLCVVFVVSESAEILYVCSEVSWAERLQH